MKRILKWIGGLILALVLVLVLSGTALFVQGGRSLDQQFIVQTSDVEPATDEVALAHGKHLAITLGCTTCHGSDLSGKVMIDAPPFRVVASNLTRGDGGIGQDYTTRDFDRAMRNGVQPDGTPLIIMPSSGYHNMADSDAAAIIGFINSLPPVNNALPTTELKPLGRILAAAGQLDVLAEVREAQPMLDVAPTSEDGIKFGQYRASLICTTCHQSDFRGGVAMGPGPVPPNIRPYGKLPADDFIRTVRTGITPGGRQMDPEAMPAETMQAWTDEELRAVHSYLATFD